MIIFCGSLPQLPNEEMMRHHLILYIVVFCMSIFVEFVSGTDRECGRHLEHCGVMHGEKSLT